MNLNFYKFYIGKRLFARHFRRAAGLLQTPVLDIGAGAAPFRRWMPDGRVTTIDINPATLPDVAASALGLPFQNASFSAAICTEVIEHVPEPAKALSEIRRVLKPGSVLYLTAPMLWSLHYEPHDYYRFTHHGLRYLLDKSGFDVSDIRPIGGLFSFICMRAGEKLFNLIYKLGFFLPKRIRWIWAVPLTLPIFHALYLLSFLLDPLMKKDVFSWGVLARAR